MIRNIGNLFDNSQSTKGGLTDNESNTMVTIREYTFLRMYVLLDPNSFSISLARSRDISSDAMLANVHSASPTAYIFEWFMSLASLV